MPEYGLLIEYDYCNGCYCCEVACKQELNLPAGQCGIRVVQQGPEIMDGKLNTYWFPLPTDNCNLCEHRVRDGQRVKPSCAKHCPAGCIMWGKVDDLAKQMKKRPKTMLWVPR